MFDSVGSNSEKGWWLLRRKWAKSSTQSDQWDVVSLNSGWYGRRFILIYPSKANFSGIYSLMVGNPGLRCGADRGQTEHQWLCFRAEYMVWSCVLSELRDCLKSDNVNDFFFFYLTMLIHRESWVSINDKVTTSTCISWCICHELYLTHDTCTIFGIINKHWSLNAMKHAMTTW